MLIFIFATTAEGGGDNNVDYQAIEQLYVDSILHDKPLLR